MNLGRIFKTWEDLLFLKFSENSTGEPKYDFNMLFHIVFYAESNGDFGKKLKKRHQLSFSHAKSSGTTWKVLGETRCSRTLREKMSTKVGSSWKLNPKKTKKWTKKSDFCRVLAIKFQKTIKLNQKNFKLNKDKFGIIFFWFWLHLYYELSFWSWMCKLYSCFLLDFFGWHNSHSKVFEAVWNAQ